MTGRVCSVIVPVARVGPTGGRRHLRLGNRECARPHRRHLEDKTRASESMAGPVASQLHARRSTLSVAKGKLLVQERRLAKSWLLVTRSPLAAAGGLLCLVYLKRGACAAP
jgi:hypothetical protein